MGKKQVTYEQTFQGMVESNGPVQAIAHLIEFRSGIKPNTTMLNAIAGDEIHYRIPVTGELIRVVQENMGNNEPLVAVGMYQMDALDYRIAGSDNPLTEKGLDELFEMGCLLSVVIEEQLPFTWLERQLNEREVA